MKKMSLRKISNLFSRKKNNYKPKLQYNDIDYEIIYVSCPNLLKEEMRDIMSQILVRFDIDSSNNKTMQELNSFAIKCINHGITIIYAITNDKVFLSCNIYQLHEMITDEFVANTYAADDNDFIAILSGIIESVSENLSVYDNEEISFELVECKHRSFRKDYVDIIKNRKYNVVDILGYTWFTDDSILDSTPLNYIWLSIEQDILNEFSYAESIVYVENDTYRVLIKMNLSSFIMLMNSNFHHCSDTLNYVKFIMDNDTEYFKPIKWRIDWSGSSSGSGENPDNDTEEGYNEEEAEITQDEFINSVLDEVIK